MPLATGEAITHIRHFWRPAAYSVIVSLQLPNEVHVKLILRYVSRRERLVPTPCLCVNAIRPLKCLTFVGFLFILQSGWFLKPPEKWDNDLPAATRTGSEFVSFLSYLFSLYFIHSFFLSSFHSCFNSSFIHPLFSSCPIQFICQSFIFIVSLSFLLSFHLTSSLFPSFYSSLILSFFLSTLVSSICRFILFL